MGSLGVAQGLPVEVVLSMAWPNPLEVGDVISQLLDAFHLLVEEVAFNEIGHLEGETRRGEESGLGNR